MSARPDRARERARFLPAETSAAEAVAVCAACAAACWAGSVPFLRDARVAIPLSLLAALPLARSFLSLLAGRSARAARTRLRMLLQHLCAAMTAGRSPESALAEALPAMVRFFGPSAPFCRALRSAVLALQAGRPFAEAVRLLPPVLPCPEAVPVFQALASGRILGPRVLDLLRASLDLATERALLEQEAASQSSSRRIEALSLAAMPFVAAFALQGSSPGYFDAAFASLGGRIALGAVYLLAVGAAALSLRIVADAPKRAGRVGRTERRRRGSDGDAVGASPDDGASASALAALAPRWLPAAYLRHLRLAFERSAENPEAALARHLAQKPLRLAIGAFAFSVPVVLAGGGLPLALPAALAGPVVLSALHDRDARSELVARDRARIAAYPMFLGLAVALLSAGLVPLRALEVAQEGLSEGDSAVADDLDRALVLVRSGCTPADALDRVALACGVPEITAALSLLAQVDRRGGAAALGLLRLQASACWALARAETRRRLEAVATRLLLPTALDLAAVVAVAGIPALLALQPPA